MSSIASREIDSAEYRDECLSDWMSTFTSKKAPYVHQTSCVYLSLVVFQNGYMTTSDEINKDKPVPLMTCLKFGYTEVGSSSVYNRLYAQFSDYDAVWSQPILVMKGMNPSALESIIKKKLEKYQIKIACSKAAKFKQPREFFEATEAVVEIVKEVAEAHDFNEEFAEEFDLDEEICEIIPSDLDPTILEVSDSLTSEQMRIVRECW